MSQSAQTAQIEFTQLAGDHTGSVYFDDFLRYGARTWSPRHHQRFPLLTEWRGIAALKTSLRALAGTLPGLPALLANRSAQLMKFGARLLCGPCRRVMTTDVGWPGYQAILKREATVRRRTLAAVEVRQPILRDAASTGQVVDLMVSNFVHENGDGLFLPAVSNEGIRLPVEQIVKAIQQRANLRVVVVDAAQEFCHVFPDLSHECYDFYNAGCHKWLGAYHPMGVGFYGRHRSRIPIEIALREMIEDADLDDPMLIFSDRLNRDRPDRYGETVDLAGLFSCLGAVIDALGQLHTALQSVA